MPSQREIKFSAQQSWQANPPRGIKENGNNEPTLTNYWNTKRVCIGPVTTTRNTYVHASTPLPRHRLHLFKTNILSLLWKTSPKSKFGHSHVLRDLVWNRLKTRRIHWCLTLFPGIPQKCVCIRLEKKKGPKTLGKICLARNQLNRVGYLVS